MKRTAKILPVLILAILMMTGQTFAADGSSYNYRVKVFSGNQGSFANGSKQVTLTCSAGDRVRLDTSELKVKCDNDKYFVKGIKEAGADNSSKSLVNSLIAKADEDKDYVIAYGLKNETVTYTVSYKDAKGNKLLSDDKYSGVVGDKPIVSFKYVAGYVPTAYNETKTLSDNSKLNKFVFYYSRTESGEPGGRTSNEPSGNNGTVNNGNGDSNTGNGAGSTQQGQSRQAIAQAGNIDGQNGNAAGNTAGNAANGSNGDQNAQNGGQPQELVDLDENEVPLAGGNGDGGSASGFNAIQTLLIALAVFAAAAILALIGRKRKKSAE